MKYKLKLIWLLLCLLILSLTACSNKVPEPKPEELQTQPLFSPSPNSKWQLVSLSTGVITQQIAGTNKDFYQVRMYVDGTADILCFDTETMTLNFWGEQPAIKNAIGGVVPVAAGDCVFAIKMGHVPFAGYEGTPCEITVFNQKGEMVSSYIFPKNTLIKLNSAIAFDGASLYLMVSKYTLNDKQPTISSDAICQVDLSTGQLHTMKTFEPEKDTLLYNVFPEGLLLMEIGNKAAITTQLYFPKDNKIIVLDEKENGNIRYTFDQNGYLYYADTETQTVYQVDLSTGQERILASNLNFKQDSKYEVILSGKIYDGKLIAALDNGVTDFPFAIDIETGKVTELTLKGQDETGHKFSLPIMGESEKYFLVMTGQSYVSTTQFGGGNSYTFEEGIGVFKLIAKEDYWNNEPKYLEFKDMVYTAQ